ncbi:MAG: CotH kinase family protein [Bacteroidaceae bacterium]
MNNKTNLPYTRIVLTLLCLISCLVQTSAQTLAEQYRSLWKEAKSAYEQAVGYRVTGNVPLSLGNLSSNASDYQEGTHLEYLVDDNPYTFWHSDWHGQVLEPHYIQIDLAEPLSGGIVLYVLRRITENNHVTRMGCHGSNDGTNWTYLGDISLPNSYSGAESTSTPIPFDGETYTSLRLYILANSSGNTFGHFAEIKLYTVEVLGESMLMWLSKELGNLQAELENGEKTDDAGITEEMKSNLQNAYDALVIEIERLNAGLLPSWMQPLTDLPTLYINTFDGAGISSKTDYKYARMWRMQGDSIAAYDSLRIRGRGNSTWGLAKKPYRLKFNQKEKFLGTGHAKAKSWTLLANHSDKTLLRNAVASFIGSQLGQPFVPSAEFADVVLNGEYLGNYQISDQMEVHKKRVDITEQEFAPVEGSDISGGYFVEFAGTLEGEPVYFHTGKGQAVAIKSPDEEVIVPEQKQYIQDFINDFETRLYSEDYLDPVKGYRAVVDSMTLASWFVANEYTANPDGYYSTYAYKEQGDDHLYWGPMWDYDIAFNNCYRLKIEMTEKLMLDEGYSSGRMKEYVQRMYGDEWFRNLAGRIWHKAVWEDSLVEKTLAYVDSMAQVIDQSQTLNFQKWSLDERVYDELMLFSTYQEGVDYLKKFLREHADFLSVTFPNPDGLLPPLAPANNPMGIDTGALYYIYNVKTENATDISSKTEGTICTWAPDEQRAATQLWQIIPVSEDYYRLVLQGSNLAITDAANFNGNSYTTGSKLTLKETEERNERQFWLFEQAGDHYAIVNKATGLAWNCSGGSSANDNPIISWTSDANNASKTTRQWYLVKGELPDGIASAGEDSDVEYRVGYDPARQEILLHAPMDIAASDCIILVYDTNGKMIGKGDAFTPVSMASQPAGIYVVTWNVHGSRRSIKFRKP